MSEKDMQNQEGLARQLVCALRQSTAGKSVHFLYSSLTKEDCELCLLVLKQTRFSDADSVSVDDDGDLRVTAKNGFYSAAHKWLVEIIHLVAASHTDEDETVNGFLARMMDMLPFTPIVISADGDTLEEGLMTLWDTQPIPKGRAILVGQHNPGDFCGSPLKLIRTLPRQRCLVCNQCNLRVKISVEINTYGDLRKYFADLAPKK